MTTQNAAVRRELRGTGMIALWTIAWVATLALAMFGTDLFFGGSPVVGWILVGINLAVGLGWIVAHARFLHKVDDLQRKVVTDALAVGLGVGVVGGLAYAVAANLGLISFDFGPAVFPVLAAVSYIVATVVGNLRYR